MIKTSNTENKALSYFFISDNYYLLVKKYVYYKRNYFLKYLIKKCIVISFLFKNNFLLNLTCIS